MEKPGIVREFSESRSRNWIASFEPMTVYATYDNIWLVMDHDAGGKRSQTNRRLHVRSICFDVGCIYFNGKVQ